MILLYIEYLLARRVGIPGGALTCRGLQIVDGIDVEILRGPEVSSFAERRDIGLRTVRVL